MTRVNNIRLSIGKWLHFIGRVDILSLPVGYIRRRRSEQKNMGKYRHFLITKIQILWSQHIELRLHDATFVEQH